MLGAPPPLISSASVFHRYPSCCSPVFLIPAAHHQRDRVIRQRPLQRLGLIPWRAHPYVSFLVCQQDHRHGLRVEAPQPVKPEKPKVKTSRPGWLGGWT